MFKLKKLFQLPIHWRIILLFILISVLIYLVYSYIVTDLDYSSNGIINSIYKKYTRTVDSFAGTGEHVETPNPEDIPIILYNNLASYEISISTANFKEFQSFFHDSVFKLHALCPRRTRLGSIEDGGWNMCISKPYTPNLKSCLVYSIGIGDEWSFDDAISTTYNCTVRAFDHTISLKAHKRGSNIWFYPFGISPVTVPVGTLKSFQDLLAINNEEKRIIDYLKMDIEHNEWQVLINLLDKELLNNVKQFGLEIHTAEMFQNGRSASLEDLQFYHSILVRLEKAGFARWSSDLNEWGYFQSNDNKRALSCCYHHVYLNTRFLTN